jgi:hypothetical protein
MIFPRGGVGVPVGMGVFVGMDVSVDAGVIGIELAAGLQPIKAIINNITNTFANLGNVTK